MGEQDPLGELADFGVSIWLDDLSRERLASAGLARLAEQWHVVGVTTNPTIFAAALRQGNAYDEQLTELASRGVSVAEAVRQITVDDVQQACDVLCPAWESTSGRDGRVSLEVNPALAHESDATLSEAMTLWKAVDRPNLMVKIPATAEGLPAIAEAVGCGLSINVTLVFSVSRYRQVMHAYLDGVELALARGHNPAEIRSVASFFVSRVDTEVDRRLEEIGTDQALALRGRAGVANARLAFAAYEEVFRSSRWAQMRSRGAQPQRPLWASTGVKNPAYPDTMYVTELAVPGTVNTMPEATMRAFADHGVLAGDQVSGRAADAQHLFDQLSATGVDMNDVFGALESEGVKKFASSWRALHETVRSKLAHGGSPQSGQPEAG